MPNIKNYISSLLLVIVIAICGFAQNQSTDIRVVNLKINFYDHNWDSLLDSCKSQGSKERSLADIEIGSEKFDSVGIKFKGNSSYNKNYKKNPFNIKLDYVIKNQNYKGRTSLKLSNLFKDPSGIREALGYKIASEYMPTPETQYIDLYINDTLTGLYLMIESIDNKYLQKHFDSSGGCFFKCDPVKHYPVSSCPQMFPSLVLGFSDDSVCYMNSYELKSEYGWTKLMSLLFHIWYNPDAKSEYYNQVNKVLNVDMALRMLAFNNIFVNLDSYIWSGHNYYIYEDTSGRFNTLLWDLNESFGGFHPGINTSELSNIPVIFNSEADTKPLVSKLLLNNDYKNTYLAYYKAIIKDWLSNGRVEKEAKKLHSAISQYIKKDPWFYYSDIVFDNALNETYNDQIPGILELMNNRYQYFKSLPELNLSSPKD